MCHVPWLICLIYVFDHCLILLLSFCYPFYAAHKDEWDWCKIKNQINLNQIVFRQTLPPPCSYSSPMPLSSDWDTACSPNLTPPEPLFTSTYSSYSDITTETGRGEREGPKERVGRERERGLSPVAKCILVWSSMCLWAVCLYCSGLSSPFKQTHSPFNIIL